MSHVEADVMNYVDELKRLISVRRLTFQNPKFQDALLGSTVSVNLQALVVHLCSLAEIEVSSVVRPARGHPEGLAIDVGNEKVAQVLLPSIATDAEVKRLKVDQIIFDAREVSRDNDPNLWNYNGGRKAAYKEADLKNHRNHIHFAVMSSFS